MQLLTLAPGQTSAVHLLFSDCFLPGALSLILSTTLAGWVGALSISLDPQKDDIEVHANTLIRSDHWAHPHSKVDSAHTVATLEAMLEVGARWLSMQIHLPSVNIQICSQWTLTSLIHEP